MGQSCQSYATALINSDLISLELSLTGFEAIATHTQLAFPCMWLTFDLISLDQSLTGFEAIATHTACIPVLVVNV